MKSSQLHEMSEQQLDARVEQLVTELTEAREAVFSGKEKNHRQLRVLRRQIAQTKGVLQEKMASSSN